MKKKNLFGGLLLLALLCPPSGAETVLVECGRDATLIEDPDGAKANGSGPFLFAGRTSQAQNGIRRGLVYFDVAAALPFDAVVEHVSLRLFHSGGNSGINVIGLHRLQADWGEGSSSASGGGGAASAPGDATWLHSFYDHGYWVRSGGQFVGRASAESGIGSNGFYRWENSGQLVQDVRLWTSNPERNFGWMLIGDETTRQNAKRLASRENPEPANRPVLEITYRLSGDR